MSYKDRKELIVQFEKVRRSRVVCYFLADRETFPPGWPGFSTQLTGEAHLFLIDHLRAIGKVPQLDVFLYTRGGATDSVWPLVSILREYAERLTIFVPFRAHSAGTLICLGADEIIMGEAAELSPIDPTTGNQFNPRDPLNPAMTFGISVEDVAAYFQLTKERGGIRDQVGRVEVLKALIQRVEPLALGNVQRVYMLIRRLATELLILHMNEKDKRIKGIIEALTEKFYSHVHAINRQEARNLMGDWIQFPTKEEADIGWLLFEAYAKTINLQEKFQLPAYMKDEPVRDLTVLGGFIESKDNSHIYKTVMKVIQRPNLPPNIQIQIPPGAPVPLHPSIPRVYEYSIQQMGWYTNQEGV